MHYLTLLDKDDVPEGQKLIQSLKRWSNDYHLTVVAFPDCLKSFAESESIRVVPLQDFIEQSHFPYKQVGLRRDKKHFRWTIEPGIVYWGAEQYGDVQYVSAGLSLRKNHLEFQQHRISVYRKDDLFSLHVRLDRQTDEALLTWGAQAVGKCVESAAANLHEFGLLFPSTSFFAKDSHAFFNDVRRAPPAPRIGAHGECPPALPLVPDGHSLADG